MTVEELIAALSQHDPKAHVVIPHEWDSHQLTVVTAVESEKVEISSGCVFIKDDGQKSVVSIG